MTSEYLLIEVRRANEIKMPQSILFDMVEFKTGKDVSSLESLALILSGHQPIRNYCFDINKFEDWCKENGLHFYLDERERMLHLRCE